MMVIYIFCFSLTAFYPIDTNNAMVIYIFCFSLTAFYPIDTNNSISAIVNLLTLNASNSDQVLNFTNFGKEFTVAEDSHRKILYFIFFHFIFYTFLKKALVFICQQNKSSENTARKGKKLLIMSNFSFSHFVFYLF